MQALSLKTINKATLIVISMLLTIVLASAVVSAENNNPNRERQAAQAYAVDQCVPNHWKDQGFNSAGECIKFYRGE